MLIIPLFRFIFSKKGLIVLGLFVGISFLTGNNPLSLLGNLFLGGSSGSNTPYVETPAENELVDFTATILGSTEDVWNGLIENYREPTLVLYTGSVNSACGLSSAATGPFYCPGDEKLYLDLSFFEEMERSLDAPGDFAQAYVIAHEVGHHIQKIMGITDQVHSLRGQMS